MEVAEHSEYLTGLFLGVSSSVFIGSSFIVKKKALLKLSKRAGQGGYGYLKEWMWWTGMILMGIGEVANFSAYAFAPATLVTPLGALSVLVSAVLASHFLSEKLNLLGKLGCLVCLLGSTTFVIHAPKEQHVDSLQELALHLTQPAFCVYVCCVVVIALVLICYSAPRYGHTNPLVYVTITGTMGSLTVMACKGLGIALKQTLYTENQLSNPLTWLIIAAMVVCITIQLNYMNKALDIFNTAVVTLLLYVVFTSCVIFASAILFKEWSALSVKDIVGNLCGFAIVICGVFLVQAFKDVNISFHTISKSKTAKLLCSEQMYLQVNS